jgi:hypothetical protein
MGRMSRGSPDSAFFDDRLPAMPESVRDEVARRQGNHEHRFQTGATR